MLLRFDYITSYFLLLICVNATRKYNLLEGGNVDFPGNDIIYWKGPFSGCAASCDATPNCVVYTLHKENGANCWLKRQLGKAVPRPNLDTYAVATRKFQLLDNGGHDYPGNDITYWKGPFSGCALQCDITPNCVAFVQHKENGANCWLKSAIGKSSVASNRDTYATTPRTYQLMGGGGVDYPGAALMYWIGPFSGCQRQCDITPKCIVYILHKENGANCWLKQRLDNPVPNKNRDSYLLQTRPYTLKDGGGVDYPGNDIVYWKGKFSECSIQCDSTPGCKAYTLHKDNGANCWLKNDLGKPTPARNRDTYEYEPTKTKTTPYASPRKYQLVKGGGVDFPRNDITYWSGAHSDCGNQCDITLGCVGYVLDKKRSRNCWLKSALVNPTPNSFREAYTVVPREYVLLGGGGVDYPQNDITYWNGPFSGCALQCDNTPKCVGYTLHKERGSNCWLKSDIGKPVPAKDRDTYAYPKHPNQKKLDLGVAPKKGRYYILLNEGNVDYPGNNIAYWNGPFKRCAAQCDATPNCIAYTLDKKNNANCWLKSGLSNPIPSNGLDTYAHIRKYKLMGNGGVHYPGRALKYWNGPFELCPLQCDSTPNCKSYTLDKEEGKNCWLYDTIYSENPTINKHRDQYELISESSDVHTGNYKLLGNNVEYRGFDIIYWKGPFSECSSQCDNTPKCVGFVLHKDNGANCWLKSDLGVRLNTVNRDTYVKEGYKNVDSSSIRRVKAPEYTETKNIASSSSTSAPDPISKNLKTRHYELLGGGGVDYPGTPKSVLTYFEGPFTQCPHECDKNPQCIVYILHKDRGANCWLKSALDSPTPNSNRDSYMVKGREYTLEDGGQVDYPGNDIKYWNGPFSGCGEECDKTPQCIAYVLHKDKGVNCWLKNKLGISTPSKIRDTYHLVTEHIDGPNDSDSEVLSSTTSIPTMNPLDISSTKNYQLVNGGGVDFPGNDIVYFNGPFHECAFQCDRTPLCVAYVLHKDNGENCWLKNELGNPVPANNRDTYNSTLIDYNGPHINPSEAEGFVTYTAKRGRDMDYPGNDITYFQGSRSECETQCTLEIRCVAFTMHESSTSCWLKSKIGEGIPFVNRVSYVKVCSSDAYCRTVANRNIRRGDDITKSPQLVTVAVDHTSEMTNQ